MINNYLPDDHYKPTSPKSQLQQYDNYQIYDIACVDITKNKIELNGTNSSSQAKGVKRIAVQAYNPVPIKCNFAQIVVDYK